LTQFSGENLHECRDFTKVENQKPKKETNGEKKVKK
jgi:hypothetical protein